MNGDERRKGWMGGWIDEWLVKEINGWMEN